MNELERLAGELSRLTDTSRRHRAEGAPTIKDIDRAAAILLAASRVDVAGLMGLAYRYGTNRAPAEQLETALRLALAGREWQGLTDEEVGELSVAGLHQVEAPLLADLIRATESKLKEKNAPAPKRRRAVSQYFVMLDTPDGGIAPLIDGDDQPVTFETLAEAIEAAESNLLGTKFGYEVFCRGEGHQ